MNRGVGLLVGADLSLLVAFFFLVFALMPVKKVQEFTL
jgi:hypothetical protein